MKVFAIGDLHLSLKKPKTMDIFGDNWIGHWDKIKASWNELVQPEDLVLVPGDISWAMYLKDAQMDLDAIGEMPGQKILLRGNHDYWWQSLNKIRAVLPDKMDVLQNNAFAFEDFTVCGTRGWSVPGSSEFSEEDEKIFKREVERMRLSLKAAKPGQDILVMTHYPPYNDKVEENAMTDLLQEFPVKRVIFGHIHGVGLKYLKEGEYFGIPFQCVSCDRLDFHLERLM